MIKTKEDLKFYISQDRNRNIGQVRGLRYLIYKFLQLDCYMAFNYLRNLRRLEYAINCRKGLLGKICFAYYNWRDHVLSRRYNITIKPNMVGYGLRLPHITGGGIVIRCKSMGNYCTVNVNVLVGLTGHNKDNRPIIGDNVSLATGAKVYGPIVLGNNVIVAPNAAVCKDVPANTIVGGIPAKIIKDFR